MKKLIAVLALVSFTALGCESVVSSNDDYGDPTMEMPAPEKPDTGGTYHE